MRKGIGRATGYLLAGALLMGGSGIQAFGSPLAGAAQAVEAAFEADSAPVAGVSETLAQALQESSEKAVELAAREEEQVSENAVPEVASEYSDIAIAQVDNYVNVRSEPNTESEVVGKLYNNSAATVLDTTDSGWYRIRSGSVEGYVKCEYVVTGDEELAKKVSTRYAKVNTTTLNVRTEPSTDAKILTLVPVGDDLVVLDESVEGWPKVSTEAGEGYVSQEFVIMATEFVQAESREEEERRLAKEEEERRRAAAAASASRGSSGGKSGSSPGGKNGSSGGTDSSQSYAAPGSSNGQAVAGYASQFIGNPYSYGGTSLTNGADCSGFVMSVYAAFGIGLPHSSSAMRGCGYEVSLSDAQPGDIVCYSGHVAIYVGGGTIVHASTPESGIKYSSVNYRSPICVRRIF